MTVYVSPAERKLFKSLSTLHKNRLRKEKERWIERNKDIIDEIKQITDFNISSDTIYNCSKPNRKYSYLYYKEEEYISD